MKYRIQLPDIQDFFHNQYFKAKKGIPFCRMTDIIEADSIIMEIKAWNTSNFKAQHIQIESKRELQIYGGIENNMVMLHFVLKGDTSLADETNRLLIMDENSNNVFTALNEKVNHSFYKNTQYEYFKVFLPYDFIFSLRNQNPEVFDPLINWEGKQRPLIFQNKPCITTMEMQLVIDQIKNCQSMGNIAPLYFDTKIQELLFLMIQQKSSQNCSISPRYKHYNNQINKARNIIENQYQNPPTIHELAKTVGMSATIMKANFKRFFGTTIYGYLFDYRMNIARKLLLNTSYTIAEIAERSGYEHASHFTTAFKRRFNISPAAFRKKVA
ncbi:AraC family transcriptional regulator [Marinilabiliaceae bacterium JC017]|nr:AraC family transcriptional regulator [Marinilabiliaceae bacterium JC017]